MRQDFLRCKQKIRRVLDGIMGPLHNDTVDEGVTAAIGTVFKRGQDKA